jgi:hypothetical protein
MAAIPASLIQSQLATLLSQYGEPLTFERGGTGGTHTDYTAFVTPAPRGGSLLQDTQEAYFDDNELAGLIQPVQAVYLDGTCSGTGVVPAIDDTFTRDSVVYAVQKIGIHRVGSTVVAYIIFASQAA